MMRERRARALPGSSSSSTSTRTSSAGVKILALDRGVTASSLVQEAIVEFLSRGQQPGTKT